MSFLMNMGFLGGSFGGGEFVLVAIVALLLFGAKNVPKIARDLGKAMEEFRRAARDVTDEIMHADEDEKPKPSPKLIAELPKEPKDERNARQG